jgi:hypothetical protein
MFKVNSIVHTFSITGLVTMGKNVPVSIHLAILLFLSRYLLLKCCCCALCRCLFSENKFFVSRKLNILAGNYGLQYKNVVIYCWSFVISSTRIQATFINKHIIKD